MRTGFYATLAGAGLALLISGAAMAKPAHPTHHLKARHAETHRLQADRHYAQSTYDYRSASLVREEFIDAPPGYWARPAWGHHFDSYAYEERYDNRVVENLRGDFTGGVGYGADGFVDGYGQTHFFVGSFRGMNPLPRSPFRPHRFGPGGRRF